MIEEYESIKESRDEVRVPGNTSINNRVLNQFMDSGQRPGSSGGFVRQDNVRVNGSQSERNLPYALSFTNNEPSFAVPTNMTLFGQGIETNQAQKRNSPLNSNNSVNMTNLLEKYSYDDSPVNFTTFKGKRESNRQSIKEDIPSEVNNSKQQVYPSYMNPANDEAKEELLTQNNQLNDQIIELQAENRLLQDQYEHMREKTQRNHDNFSIQLEEKANIIHHLEKELEFKKQRLDDLQKDFEGLRSGMQKVDSNFEQLTHLKQKLAELKEENEKKESTISRLTIQGKKLESQLELNTQDYEKLAEKARVDMQQKKENEELKREKDMLESRMRFLKTELEQKTKLCEEAEITLKENEEHKKRIKKLETQVDDVHNSKDKVVELYNKIEQLEQKINENRVQHQKSEITQKRRIEELIKNEELLKMNIDFLKKELDSRKADFNNYEKMINKTFENQEEGINISESMAFKYNAKMEELGAHVEYLSQVIEKLEENLENKESELIGLETDLRNTNSQLIERAEEYYELEDKSNGYKAEVKRLKDCMAQMTKKTDQNELVVHLKKTIMEMANNHTIQIRQLQNELIQQKQYNNTKPNDKTLNDSHKSTVFGTIQESLLKSKADEINKLKKENERLASYVDSYKTNTLDMEDKVNTLIDKHERLKIRYKEQETVIQHFRTNIGDMGSVNTYLAEIKELQMKNRVLEIQNKKLNVSLLSRLKDFG